jgi:hypothetical protein
MMIARMSMRSTMTMKSMKTTTDLLAVSLCACAHIGATYPVDGWMTSFSSSTVRRE